MKPLNKKATSVFYDLLAILGDKSHVKIDNAPSAYMALHVDRLGRNNISLSHYYYQCGDAMADPDMQFYINPDNGLVYPYTYQLDGLCIFEESIIFDEVGSPLRYGPKLQAQHAVFASQWMLNIQEQQGIMPANTLNQQAAPGCHQERL